MLALASEIRLPSRLSQGWPLFPRTKLLGMKLPNTVRVGNECDERYRMCPSNVYECPNKGSHRVPNVSLARLFDAKLCHRDSCGLLMTSLPTGVSTNWKSRTTRPLAHRGSCLGRIGAVRIPMGSTKIIRVILKLSCVRALLSDRGVRGVRGARVARQRTVA